MMTALRGTVIVLALATTAFSQAPTIGPCNVFPADDIWNTRIDQLPVSPNSSTYVSTIGGGSPLHPDFGTVYNGAPNGIPFITVSGMQTGYYPTFTYAGESDPGPYYTPLNAPIEGGSNSTGDRHVISIDTDNCTLYELYAAYPVPSTNPTNWQAGSGAIFNLESYVLRPATWTSADAAGLPIFPGLVRYDDAASGVIRHALRFTVPKTQRAYVWPARHYASTITDPTYPPMGVRFRLKASFDISGFSPINQVILTALKQYGMMIADNGSAWYLSGAPDPRWNDSDLHNLTTILGSNFEVVDVSPLMIDPNSSQALQGGITVNVTPPSATVNLGAKQQFMATVTGATDPSVTWSVNGAPNGNSTVGFVDTTGLYTAPNVNPNTAITVEASSNQMPTAVGSATVTLTNPPPVTITISPTSTTVKIGNTRQFTATVQNAANKSVTWEVNGVAGGNTTIGTISTTGLYRAPRSVPSPNTVTVTAVSVADSTKSASALVKISKH